MKIQKIVEELSKLGKNVKKMSKPENVIVKDSQFVTISNKRNKKVLSNTNEDAINEARYNNIRDGKPLEGDLDMEGNKQAEDEVIDRYMRDFFDQNLG